LYLCSRFRDDAASSVKFAVEEFYWYILLKQINGLQSETQGIMFTEPLHAVLLLITESAIADQLSAL